MHTAIFPSRCQGLVQTAHGSKGLFASSRRDVNARSAAWRRTRFSRQARDAQLAVHAAAAQPDGPPEQPAQPEQSEGQSQPGSVFGFSTAAGSALIAQAPLVLLLGGSGGGAGGFGSGGDGGGGSGPSGRVQEIFSIAEDEDDDDEEEDEEEEEEDEEEADGTDAEEEKGKRAATADTCMACWGLHRSRVDWSYGTAEPASGAFVCGEMVATGLPVGEGIPLQDDLFAGLHCQPGETFTRMDLSEDMKALSETGLFESVNARVEPPNKKGKSKVVFEFIEKKHPPLVTFNVEGATSLPPRIVRELQRELQEEKGQPFSIKTMAKIRNKIEGWYQSRGFGMCYIENWSGMPDGNVVAHVREGKTSKVNIVYMDEDGTPTKEAGKIPPSFVRKFVPIEEGTLYNMNDGRKTLQNVFALELFENVQILPRQNERDTSKIEVDVMVREKPTETADIEGEWGLAAGESGYPALVSLIPGGTIAYENRNFLGKVGQLGVSVNTKNFLAPADDLSFRLSYSQPFIFGLDDPKRTKLTASVFNGRKLCGVFTPGPNGSEVPPVWIDRQGAKVAVSEQYSRQSRGSLGLVLEEVAARDETGALCNRGMRSVGGPYNGQIVQDGPPTTLSDSGRDRMVFAQGSFVRDTTYLVNGGQVGARDIFTVDQGLGIGTQVPFFNRATAQLTRFLQLRTPGPASKSAPVTLVLHGRAGNAIGDLPAYDAFLLGGPHSVRGYNYGELATCRRFLEGAVEVRVPVKGQQVYAFYERGTDLGSSKDVRGNPTEYFRRVGAGSSLGAGLKVGALRAEMVRDNNAGKWDLFLQYGERF
ncbi:hypothetical protein N2152v2_009040 [Parachlorella kessleri]